MVDSFANFGIVAQGGNGSRWLQLNRSTVASSSFRLEETKVSRDRCGRRGISREGIVYLTRFQTIRNHSTGNRVPFRIEPTGFR